MVTQDSTNGSHAESVESTNVLALRAALEQILNLDVKRDLVRERELGNASFKATEPLFNAIIAYVRTLEGLPWGDLTNTSVDAVTRHLETLARMLSSVATFELAGEPIPARDNLAVQVVAQFDAFRDATLPFVGYLSWRTVDLSSVRQRVSAVMDDSTARIDAALADITAKREEADQTLAAIRAISAEAGVAHHADTFAATAKRHGDAAARWLKASVGAAVLTVAVGLGVVLLWEVEGNLSDASTFQLVAGKAIILGVGLILTFNCLRMYRSHSHLEIVAKHREDALKTFRAFADGAADVETKDKVLLEATHAVFAPAVTGLVDGKDGSESIEILDGVSSLIRRR